MKASNYDYIFIRQGISQFRDWYSTCLHKAPWLSSESMPHPICSMVNFPTVGSFSGKRVCDHSIRGSLPSKRLKPPVTTRGHKSPIMSRTVSFLFINHYQDLSMYINHYHDHQSLSLSLSRPIFIHQSFIIVDLEMGHGTKIIKPQSMAES